MRQAGQSAGSFPRSIRCSVQVRNAGDSPLAGRVHHRACIRDMNQAEVPRRQVQASPKGRRARAAPIMANTPDEVPPRSTRSVVMLQIPRRRAPPLPGASGVPFRSSRRRERRSPGAAGPGWRRVGLAARRVQPGVLHQQRPIAVAEQDISWLTSARIRNADHEPMIPRDRHGRVLSRNQRHLPGCLRHPQLSLHMLHICIIETRDNTRHTIRLVCACAAAGTMRK